MHHFQSEAGDPLHQPVEGSLIWQLGAKSRRIRTHGDRAVVKFCAKRHARLTREGDFIRLGSHQDYASSLAVHS